MKFKLGRSEPIKFGDKEIPVSKTDGWTDIPDDDIIKALQNAGSEHGHADWDQNDEKNPGYIKNRPCYNIVAHNDGDTVVDIVKYKPGHIQKIGTWKYYTNLDQETMDKNLGYSSTLSMAPVANYWIKPCYSITHRSANGTESTGRGYARVWNNSSIQALDEVNWCLPFPKYKLYFIVNRAKLSEDNKNKFPTIGFFLEVSDSFSVSSPIISFKIWVEHNVSTLISSTLLPKNIQYQGIVDSNNYFSTKTVEGALNQIGAQFDEYFGYTIDENSVVEVVLKSATTAETSGGFLPDTSSTYLMEFANQKKFVIGRPSKLNGRFNLYFYTGYHIFTDKTDSGTIVFNFNSEHPTFISSTVGEVAFKIYKVTISPGSKRGIYNALELSNSYCSNYEKDVLACTPVYQDDTNLMVPASTPVVEYITTPLRGICKSSLGAQVVYLRNVPSSVTTAPDYEKLNLTSKDYPIIVTCTTFDAGSSPSCEYIIATSSGRSIYMYLGLISGTIKVQERVHDSLTIQSSTPDSSKKFKITVDDTGTLSATEVTDES